MPVCVAMAAVAACGQAALLISLDNLLSFPWIRERVDAGRLILHGWYFDIETGQLLAYSSETSTFDLLSGHFRHN